MFIITPENYKNVEVDVVIKLNKKYFWVKMYDVGEGLVQKNISDTVKKNIEGKYIEKPTREQYRKYKRSLADFKNDYVTYSNKIIYIRNDLTEKIIKNCRGVKKSNGVNREKIGKQRQNFRTLLGFKENDTFLSKEQSVLNKIMKIFSRDEIILQHKILDYQIDAYFPKYKLAIEIDELGHRDKKRDKEITRENSIKQKLQCKFSGINPDNEKYDADFEINKINYHMMGILENQVANL